MGFLSFLLITASGVAAPEVAPRPTLVPAVAAAPLRVAEPELYERPLVAPYEPPSDFGRMAVEGDAVGRAGRGAGRPDAETDYHLAVEERRQRAQALMGPLDGLWRVTDSQGRELLDLSLTDRGPGRPLDGVWLGQTPAGAPRSSSVAVLLRQDEIVRLGLGDGLVLELTRGADGWRGSLIEGRRRQAAVLRPVTP